MTAAKVSIIRCRNYNVQQVRKVLLRHFELLGGIENFIDRGDKVLIKPNLIAPKPRAFAVQTDPAVIVELAKILLDFGAKPFVADSPAWADTKECVNVLGIADTLSKLSVEVKQLNRPVKCRLQSGIKVGISSVALEADKIINLPKLKSHQQVGATIAVKNMFGCVSGKAKAVWHFRKGGSTFEFCRMLIDIYRFLAPVITIIDGVIAMEGPGPIRGLPRELGWLVAGSDPIAEEIICCQLTGLKAEQLPILNAAEQIGFGCLDKEQIEILGDDYSDYILTDFAAAEQIPLRFSLSRITKSIGRQIWMLAKSKG